MKRFLGAALFLCSSATAQAQAEYKFTDYVSTAHGFSATLQFRNTNAFGDPKVLALDNFFSVTAGQRIKDFCTTVYVCDWQGDGGVQYIGNVQRGEFFAGDFPYPWFYESSYEPRGCFFWYCDGITYVSNSYAKVLGCQVPATSSIYTGRTCDAAGFDGWLAVAFRFRWDIRYDGDSTIVMPDFDTSDLNATFHELELQGPNVMTAVPEPSAWAMIAMGLLAVGVLRRRRA